jgi:hypothetical protein
VAQRLLRTTDRAFQLVVSEGWLGRLFRTRILARVAARAMTLERVRRLAFRTISQIGIRYRCSRLSQTLDGVPEASPRAGDRFPWLQDLFDRLDDTRFNLLVFGQPAPPAEALGVGDLCVVHEVQHAANAAELGGAGIAGPAFYLLRPDGHVGLAGRRLDADSVKRYFAQRHFRMGQASAGASRPTLRAA